jgi:hypothetical protein
MDQEELASLPASLRSLFWDCDFSSLNTSEHRNFIIRRILQSGDWEAVNWLRDSMGDTALRRWIEGQNGRGFSPRQLRFWELVLNIPSPKVDRWIKIARKGLWEQRLGR